MRRRYGRQLVRSQLAFGIAAGLALLVLYVAQPAFMGGPVAPPPWESPYLILAAGLYLVGLAWMLEIARGMD